MKKKTRNNPQTWDELRITLAQKLDKFEVPSGLATTATLAEVITLINSLLEKLK